MTLIFDLLTPQLHPFTCWNLHQNWLIYLTTDERTDGRTDGQPENIVAASAGLAWQRHNENASFEIWIKMYKFLEFSELIFVVHG